MVISPPTSRARLYWTKIRERNRAIHRLEVGQPEAKWKIFREQCRKEQKGLQAMEWRLDQKRDQVNVCFLIDIYKLFPQAIANYLFEPWAVI